MKDTDSVTVSIAGISLNENMRQVFRLQLVRTSVAVFHATLLKKEVLQLAARTEVAFINEYRQPTEELNTGAVDYTLNRINQTHKYFPTIKGDSITISVKERAFDTTDIDLQGRIFSSGAQASTQTSHAALMATIVAGAGNSSPFAKGVATGSWVSSADFANLFPEADSFYRRNGISIQNHSYGTVVENFYGNEAVAYDQNMQNNATLLHVFSAGNSGTTTPATGTYAGIAGMANLTGNFKQSKNSLSVAALDSSGHPMAGASKGPAYDGRVKPELAAYGEDGSSGAAALVSGAAALVQEAFQNLTGRLPNSDLVKSVLVNSAEDVGAAGIDYQTGYGSLNAYNAVTTVVQSRFWQDSVANAGVKTFSLTVPANVAKLKITLAWTDPASQPNATKALVNDLDLVLRHTATGTVREPWVLSAVPNKDSLLQAPLRKKDTLNNIEQISVDLPTGGNYQVEVKGSKLVTMQQAFAVSYQFDTSGGFRWTYPLEGEVLLPAQTGIVRWNTTAFGTADLQLSFDRMNWTPVEAAVPLSSQQYRWHVPDTTAVAFLRMNVGGNYFVTDSFVISPQLQLNVGFVCSDSFQLNWEKLPVQKYRLYRLGEKYMEPFLTVGDTAVVFSKTQHPYSYYSVAPVMGAKEGLRSHTIRVDASGAGCYLLAFYLQLQTGNDAVFTGELGTLYNVDRVLFQKRTDNGFVTVQSFKPSTTRLAFSDTALLKGENVYRLQLLLQNGTAITSQPEKVYYSGDKPVYLYPNPVGQQGRIIIISTESGRFTVQFLNVAGKEVYRQFITNSFVQLPASKFPKGMYFVKVTDKNGDSFVQKILIQ